MIASVFKKSTPLNYALVVFLMLFFFGIYQLQDISWTNSMVLIAKKTAAFLVLIFSIFLTSFIAKKNSITKDSTYTAFFYFLLLLFSPTLFDNLEMLVANFFVLLAMRRLISLQNTKLAKEKIFDASLWIFVASIFHFWCILFLVLVFISIILHVASDYRNWFIPFIAFFIICILYLVYALLIGLDLSTLNQETYAINLALDFYENKTQNAAFSIYVSVVLFFLFSMILTFSNRPIILHQTYKKIMAMFLLALGVFVLSTNKSNDLLLFTFAPLSILATIHVEFDRQTFRKDVVLGIFILCSVFLFLFQL